MEKVQNVGTKSAFTPINNPHIFGRVKNRRQVKPQLSEKRISMVWWVPARRWRSWNPPNHRKPSATRFPQEALLIRIY